MLTQPEVRGRPAAAAIDERCLFEQIEAVLQQDFLHANYEPAALRQSPRAKRIGATGPAGAQQGTASGHLQEINREVTHDEGSSDRSSFDSGAGPLGKRDSRADGNAGRK